MDMDILAADQARLDAVSGSARLDEAERRLDALLHNVAQLSSGADSALTRHRDRLDRQQLAADFGPGKAGHGADLILFLTDAEPIFSHSGEVCQVRRRDHDLRVLALEDAAQALARQLGNLALE